MVIIAPVRKCDIVVWCEVSKPARQKPPHPLCIVCVQDSAVRPRTHCQAGQQLHGYLLAVLMLDLRCFSGRTVENLPRKRKQDVAWR